MIGPRLSLDDLERIAYESGGTIETHPRGFILRTLIDGTPVVLGPVAA